MSRVRRHRGMVLILVSGILVILGVASAAIVSLSVGRWGFAQAAIRGTAARLGAASGLEYAVSRLFRQRRPVPVSARSPANAGDDWAMRDDDLSAPPALSAAPSYARGDRWTDDPGHSSDGQDNDGDGLMDEPFEGAGAWTAGDGLAADLDGNGRFDACTGRLRGGGKARHARFSLRVTSAESLACINGGELGSPTGDHDMDGILNDDDPDYAVDLNPRAEDLAIVPNGVPDWRDTDFQGNTHLVRLLDNLGAVAGLPAYVEPFAPDTPLGTVEVSHLGRVVVANRPRGGYGEVGDLLPVMIASGFTGADYAKVAPYLSVQGEIVPVAMGPGFRANPLFQWIRGAERRYEFHARVDLNLVPEAVLRAMLRYLTASGTFIDLDTHNTLFVRLQKDEADAIARHIAWTRPFADWGAFLAALEQVPPGSIEADPDWYGGALDDPWRWKQDLILAQFDANPFFPDPFTWKKGALGIPREAAPVGTVATRTRLVAKNCLGRLVMSEKLALTSTTPSRMTTEAALTSTGSRYGLVSQGTLSGASAGGMASVRMESDVDLGGDGICMTGQQDFERLPRTLADPSSPHDVWRSAGGEVRTEGPLQARQGIQSHPRFPFAHPDAAGVPVQNYSPEAVHAPDPSWSDGICEENEVRGEYAYPAVHGDLRLSARQWTDAELGAGGANGCVFALPFNEDGAPGLANRYSPADWRDNLGDPLKRFPFNYTSLTLGDDDPLPSGWRRFHEGFACSPQGVRAVQDVIDLTFPVHQRYEWLGAGGQQFPLPRAQPAPGQYQEIREGTIEFWFASLGGECSVPSPTPEMRQGCFVLQYSWLGAPGQIHYADYLTVVARRARMVAMGDGPHYGDGAEAKDRIQIRSNGAPATAVGVVPDSSAAWHHAAIIIRDTGLPGDGVTRAVIYIDGQPPLDQTGVPTAPLDVVFKAGHTPMPSMRFLVAGFHCDDLRFFDKALTEPEVEALAAEDRFARQGDFLSPRWIFDEARYPEGARIEGITWDAFMPAELAAAGASVIFTVTGHKTSGPDESRSATWTAGAPQEFLFAAPIPGCRSVDVRVTIDALTAPAPLLDTPIIDEIRLLHRRSRPGILGIR